MVRLIWADSAISELDAIADYIALDNPNASRRLVRLVMEKVKLLESFPEMCPHPHDIETTRYRHLSVPPIRIFYRFDGEVLYVVHIIRNEQLLRIENLDD